MAFWDRISSRGNVEDRRSLGAVGAVSLTGVLLIMGVNLLMGGSLEDSLNQVINILPQNGIVQDSSQFEGQDEYEVFVSQVLGSGDDTWRALFAKQNMEYIPPKLVLFRELTQSACGYASSQVGPHYCQLDQTIYLDETFFDELTSKLGAQGGDVAQAYVIAHELGHHVQNLLGIFDRTSGDNEASIQTELQADCYAGIWAHSLRNENIFEPGEIAEAMDAAAAVGDDRIQEKVQGYSSPETWTHGSSAQRVEWFEKGYQQGTLEDCNTFGQ